MNNTAHCIPNLATALQDARMALQESLALSSADAILEARVLLSYSLNKNTAYLLAYGDALLTEAEHRRFRDLIQRRCEGVPIAYLTGQREFYGLNFIVTPGVLIPRPETELLLDLALAHIPPAGSFRILDMGTGSGVIAVTLAKARPQSQLTAIDVSGAALKIAASNAARHAVENIQFIKSDWFSALDRESPHDFIVANPPYLDEQDRHAQQGDLRFEPKAALLSGKQGLTALRSIVRSAPSFLNGGGYLLVEHGYDQRQLVLDLFEASGFLEIQAFDDLAGQPRCIVGKKSDR